VSGFRTPFLIPPVALAAIVTIAFFASSAVPEFGIPTYYEYNYVEGEERIITVKVHTSTFPHILICNDVVVREGKVVWQATDQYYLGKTLSFLKVKWEDDIPYLVLEEDYMVREIPIGNFLGRYEPEEILEGDFYVIHFITCNDDVVKREIEEAFRDPNTHRYPPSALEHIAAEYPHARCKFYYIRVKRAIQFNSIFIYGIWTITENTIYTIKNGSVKFEAGGPKGELLVYPGLDIISGVGGAWACSDTLNNIFKLNPLEIMRHNLYITVVGDDGEKVVRARDAAPESSIVLRPVGR